MPREGAEGKAGAAVSTHNTEIQSAFAWATLLAPRQRWAIQGGFSPCCERSLETFASSTAASSTAQKKRQDMPYRDF